MIKEFKENNLEFIKVKNNAGLEVTFCSLGAAIFSISFSGDFMTYNPKNSREFHRKNVYHGKTIGRVAGRITGNKITIDDKTYILAANEGENVLHGGNGAFSEKVFSSKTYSDNQYTHVVYSYLSKDGESGFPGEATVEVCYLIANDEPSLIVEFNCKVSKKCPISLTNHSYFCLGEKNIDNLKLKVDASKYILMNNNDLTLKETTPVPSYLDFRDFKSLVEDINVKEINQGKLCGYDHILLLDKNGEVVLESTKYKMNISTDLDTIVFYTDNYDARFEANNSNEILRRGVALEPQLNPLKDRILKPGEEYRHFIKYSFQNK